MYVSLQNSMTLLAFARFIPSQKSIDLIASVSTTHAIPSSKKHKGWEGSSESFHMPVPYQENHFFFSSLH